MRKVSLRSFPHYIKALNSERTLFYSFYITRGNKKAGMSARKGLTPWSPGGSDGEEGADAKKRDGGGNC